MLEEYSSAYQFQFTPLREGRLSGVHGTAALLSISIHAPPRGATYLLGNGVELENITIHAPPRGATTRPPSFGWGGTDFNSRPSARGDVAALSEKAGISKFQFTPLREGRQSSDTP